MKKIITNLAIVCSMALAGAVMAQEPTPEASQTPGKNRGPKKEQPTEVKPAPTRPPKNEKVVKEPNLNQAPATTPVPTAPPTKTDRKSNKKEMTTTAPKTNTTSTAGETPAATPATTPDVTKNSKRNNKNSKTPATDASVSPAAGETPATTPGPKTKATVNPPAAKTTSTPAPTVAASATPKAAATAATTPAATMTPAAVATITPATAASATAAPSVSQTTTTNVAKTKKPDPAKVQEIKQQHQTFRAQAKPQVVPAVTFSENYRLPGAERWQGPQYEVYRSYHPERHDRGWYHQHYQRVELIAGGYYYFNNGYWYPAWGYDAGNQYYAYDAPIYVGHRSDPPDKVIADVQAVLKDMGYYRGEVDGLMGPLTREALTQYQTDNGMQVTAVIDEPTLDSLDMG